MRHFVMCTYFDVSETETAFAPGYALAKAVFDYRTKIVAQPKATA
ncbi:MAG: hypothetical protein ACK5WH_04615 [Hyphomonadaceae bacterium]